MLKGTEIAPGAILVRFSIKTPYWPLSTSYGIFCDPSTQLRFVSLDHYIGYNMLLRQDHRVKVLEAPNGYISNRELDSILHSHADGHEPIVDPEWEARRRGVMAEGLRLKFSQSSFALNELVRTGDRPIYDVSREKDHYWCYSSGRGMNAHGELLMELRARVASGDSLAQRA